MSSLNSLIKFNKNQNPTLLLPIQARIAKKIILKNIRTVTTNSLIISKSQDTMRSQVSYSADSLTFKSEVNMAIKEAVN